MTRESNENIEASVQDSSFFDNDEKIRRRILDWASPIFPLAVRDEAARVYCDYNRSRTTEEVEAYTGELEFGTGGMRGVIGNGSGRMNRWTVGRATVGFCNYILSQKNRPSIVIAYDSRRMSEEFASTTAGIAARLGFSVYLFDVPTPTPMLSYAIRKLKASGGVVITASHNPPEYNGYKVFLHDGAQLVGNEQEEVEKAISSVEDWSRILFLDRDDPLYKERVKIIGEDIKNSYYAECDKLFFAVKDPANSRLNIVYSPLHGTGGAYLPELLERYGYKVELVKEEALPNGDFPTVKYPNPEEAEAMKLSQEKAIALNADMFLATDPDADRLGAGIKQADGTYALLNGNQIGSIMCAYLAEKYAESVKSGKSKKGTAYIFKTIVTTDLQKEIAVQNGVAVRSVLTGFKYIAEQMNLLERGAGDFDKSRDTFLFGGEESFGYLPVDFVRDKDSLSSALLLCRILSEKGDLLSYLNDIYLRYGLYMELLKSVTLKGRGGQQKISEVIEQLRRDNPVGWKLGDRQVTNILDYKHKTRNGLPSAKDFEGLPSSNVIQLLLEPEGTLTIRPSGTEPKVKLYAGLRSASRPVSPEELLKLKREIENELVVLAGIFFARTGLTG